MKNLILIFVATIFIYGCNNQSNQNVTETNNSDTEITSENKTDTIPFGNNGGQKVSVNGIEMYYEIYGEGDPLVIIHGNGEDISKMAGQIDYFKSKYKVIVADSRGHGKSEMNTDKLTLA